MALKLFQRKGKKLSSPIASIAKKGSLCFNITAAQRFLDGVDDIEIYWDEKDKIVGIKPISKETSNSYKVSRGKHSVSISLVTFFKTVGVDFSKIKHYTPYEDGEFIKINLNEEM